MVRAADGQDYYVYEPALAEIGRTEDVVPVLPTRWFCMDGEHWAKVHRLRSEVDGFVIEGSECIELPLTAFKLCMQRLERSYKYHGLPPPHILHGKFVIICAMISTDVCPGVTFDGATIKPWLHVCPNPWRAKATGRRVIGVPLWIYCDDTSGNVSKKWNKHNSILITFAGLPREFVQMGYNIHFLSTSNLAPPLEQAEALVDRLGQVLPYI